MDDKYICFEGTKQEIADQIGDKLCFPATDNLSKGYQDFQKIFIDLLMVNHTSLLSAEEEFQIQCPQNNAGKRSFVTTDARYYIGLKKATFYLVLVVTNSIASKLNIDEGILHLINSALQTKLPSKDMALYTKLSAAMGESCVVLEAANNKGKGINKKTFPPKNGECINNHLNCRMRCEEKCLCTPNQAEEIYEHLCEKGILVNKEGRYFYLDFI